MLRESGRDDPFCRSHFCVSYVGGTVCERRSPVIISVTQVVIPPAFALSRGLRQAGAGPWVGDPGLAHRRKRMLTDGSAILEERGARHRCPVCPAVLVVFAARDSHIGYSSAVPTVDDVGLEAR